MPFFDGASAQDAVLAAAIICFDHGFQRRELPLNAADAIDRRPVELVARRTIVNMVIGCHHVTIIPIPL